MADTNHSSVPAGFKEIPLHEGRYFINEQGDVWSVARKRLMCPQTDATHLYPWVLVMENGKAQPRTVYYLMRLTWMPSAPGEVGSGRGKWCVNHKDGNKLNSHIDNLEWTTHEGNLRHAWENNLHSHGENCSWAQFTSEQVREIRLRLLAGENVTFYDYTKVKHNWAECKCLGYHLTFSFDGYDNRANFKLATNALSAGVNIAAAFNVKKGKPLPGKAYFGNRSLSVVDGDLTDFRPSDPNGYKIIGLRFKLPHGIKWTPAQRDAFCLSADRMGA